MGNINISKRLKAIVSYIKDGSNVLDIGCDHGLLSIYIALNRNDINVLASDINELPLKSAIHNIKKYNVQSIVKTVLCNGANGVDITDISDIVVAGMGGELIFKIVWDIDRTQILNKNLLLQPMTNTYHLRKNLVSSGFFIIDETAVFDNNKYYTIILAKYKLDKMIIKYNDIFYYFGALKNKNDENSVNYKRNIIARLEQKLDGLKKCNVNRIEEIIKLQKLIFDLTLYI